MANTKRAVPTTKDFYKTKKGTQIYVALLLQSSLNQETRERYVEKSRLNVSQLCADLDVKSTKTYYNNLDKLKAGGFIEVTEDKIIITKDFIFTLIEKETLSFLMNSTNTYAVAVYAELAWRWEFFTEKKSGRAYFTQNVLIDQLGLSSAGTSHKMIRDILTNLQNNGLIDWKTQNTTAGNQVMYLTKLEKVHTQKEVEHDIEVIEEKEVIKQTKITRADALKEFGGKF